EKFLETAEPHVLVAIWNSREAAANGTQKRGRNTSDSARQLLGAVARVAGEQLVAAGAAQCYRDMLPCAARQQVVEVCGRIAERLIEERKHVEKVEGVDVGDGQLRVLGAQVPGNGPRACALVIGRERGVVEDHRVAVNVMTFCSGQPGDHGRVRAGA